MRTLRTAVGTLEFSEGDPWLMATVLPGPGALERAREAAGAGARIIGIRAGREMPELTARLRAELEVPLAVLTGELRCAAAGLAAGAAIVDASGGIESAELPELCARSGAGLVVPAGTTATLPEGALMYGALGCRAPVGERPLLLHAESPELALELAAIARGVEHGASVLAVCDLAAAVDFLAVHGVLNGRRGIDPDLRLPVELRREPAASAAGVPPPS